MKIAFLHYHLKPGGVTTVIKQQIDAVKDACDVLIITGEAPEKKISEKTIILPEIGYDHPAVMQSAPQATAERILQAIDGYWPSGCDILHVHNPLLAKNTHFLKVLSFLQDHHIRLLLQTHDFAEDGRFQVYYADDPYPRDCHFCVINSRDYQALLKSGLKKTGLHLLMNMVTPFDISYSQKIAQDFILYPVRAIRRKNIGEAILLSLFFPKNRSLAITLPPNSSQDRFYYNAWKQFAASQRLNILFEASAVYNFTDLAASAKSMITTSISEGFGFSYLEPWTAGQMLSGRMLPDICIDLQNKGLILEHLYNKIAVPIDLIDLKEFSSRWKSCIRDHVSKFKISIPERNIDMAFERMLNDQYVDFAILDEFFQRQVLSNILSDPRAKSRFLALNPFLPELPFEKNRRQTVCHNRRIVETQFDRTDYRKRLLKIYQKVMHCTVHHTIDKQKLAGTFFVPEQFSLLKWSRNNA